VGDERWNEGLFFPDAQPALAMPLGSHALFHLMQLLPDIVQIGERVVSIFHEAIVDPRNAEIVGDILVELSCSLPYSCLAVGAHHLLGDILARCHSKRQDFRNM
jgi:hypothetical protein